MKCHLQHQTHTHTTSSSRRAPEICGGGAENILEVSLERVPGRRMPLGFEWQDVSKHDCKVQGESSGKCWWLMKMKFEAVGELHSSKVLGGVWEVYR